MLLAINTSTSWASLALVDGATVRAVRSWAVGQQHSVQIFGAIDVLLDAAGTTRDTITAIGVATGPGSFNGLRVAVTVAKTLAFVWGVPVVGVTSLAALAQAYALQDGSEAAEKSVLAVLEAGRDELYVGWYNLKNDVLVMQQEGDIAIASLRADDAAWDVLSGRSVVITGELTEPHRAALVASLAERGSVATLATPLAAPDRALCVATLAQAQIALGITSNLLTLEPTYVRRPNISTSTRHVIPGPPVGEGNAAR